MMLMLLCQGLFLEVLRDASLESLPLQGHLGIHDAIESARLEETFQMDEWGLVEGGHDIDIADMQVRIAGPAVFIRLLQASL